MKKILFTLIAILSLSIFNTEARTFVLAVGMSNSAVERPLSFASASAKDFANLMKEHTNDVTVMTSSNATKSAILSKLKQIAQTATSKDRIYFYIATHGGDNCITAYDDYISYNEVCDILSESASPMCLCIIDSCHSGSSKNVVKETSTFKGRKNIAFMTGCRPEESSYFGGTLTDGMFTKAVIKGLRGKSDANGDKRITVKELFKYVYNDVVKRSTTTTKNGDTPTVQHPQLIAPANIQEAAVVVWK